MPDNRELLLQLIELGGDTGRLAQGALEALDEREARAAAEAAAEDRLELAAETGGLDMTDEQTLDDLRLQVQARRTAADEAVIVGIQKSMAGQGFSKDDIDLEVARLKEQQALVAQMEAGSDPLHDSPVYREWQASEVAKAKALQLASDEVANRPGYLDLEVERAQAHVDGVYDSILAGAGASDD